MTGVLIKKKFEHGSTHTGRMHVKMMAERLEWCNRSQRMASQPTLNRFCPYCFPKASQVWVANSIHTIESRHWYSVSVLTSQHVTVVPPLWHIFCTCLPRHDFFRFSSYHTSHRFSILTWVAYLYHLFTILRVTRNIQAEKWKLYPQPNKL